MKKKDNKSQAHSEEKLRFWHSIYSFAKGDEKKITTIILLSLLTGIAVALQPLVIKYIVDNGISAVQASNRERLIISASYCGVYIVLSFIRVGLWALAYNITIKTIEGVIFKIRSGYFHHVEHLCMRFHEHISVGELYNSIMGSPINNIKTYLQQMMLVVPFQSVSFVISLCALMYYDWLLTLVLVLVAAVMVLFNFFARSKIRRISGEYIKKESETSKYITDVLNGMDAIKVYSIEEDVYKTFNSYASMIRNEGIRLTYSQYLEQVKPELTNFVGIAVVYMVGAFSCIYRGVSTGVLFAFINSMNIILSALTTWLNTNLQKQSAVSGLQRVMNVLDAQSSTPEVPTERKRDTEIEKNAAQRKNEACIEFKHVKFAYADTPVYKDLSCKIGYNESVGLVGGSGSGKSTFTKLIMRLYDIQDGEITIHGRDIKDFQLHDLRKTFGVVPQNPFIFQGSIMDNIRIARPDCKNIDIINAMEIAHVHEFVNELPNGWHTIVGESGLNLSGGQKQRIAIARAVLGNPDILIFDEATSALDNISERHIQQAMEELMKEHTVIIVAHRLSTIKNVDKIMVFDKGDIVEQGSYAELAAKKGGVFYDLLNN